MKLEQSQQKYLLTEEEMPKKDELVAKGWTYIPDEKIKLVSPSGVHFIWLDSALEYQKEQEKLEEKGVVFKIGQDRNRFGWGVWFKTKKYITYKLWWLYPTKKDAEHSVQQQENWSKEENLKYWDNFPIQNWLEDDRINKPKIVQFHSGYWTDTIYTVSCYTEMVNLCIYLVTEDLDILNTDHVAEPVKPSFDLENVPAEFKRDAEKLMENYEQNLKYYNKINKFNNLLKELRKIKKEDYRKYHIDFVNIVFDNPETFMRITVSDAAEFEKYI